MIFAALKTHGVMYSNMWLKFLQFMGFRSTCCGVKNKYVYGWDYNEDHYECSKCGKKSY